VAFKLNDGVQPVAVPATAGGDAKMSKERIPIATAGTIRPNACQTLPLRLVNLDRLMSRFLSL
jgi:hypothetical protein